jgi:alpha-L-rhamnosidase
MTKENLCEIPSQRNGSTIMNYLKWVWLTIWFILVMQSSFGQTAVNKINPDLLNKVWPAFWINHPTASASGYGVFYLRKNFKLDAKPDRFIVHISADNRYKLFVNGEFVCLGPSQGDLMHWNYESMDIASLLRQGDNLIAAMVWNYGEYKPIAQISSHTAFILQGDTNSEFIVNSNSSWKILQDEAYSPVNSKIPGSFFAIGPCDRIDAGRYPWGWEKLGFDDGSWKGVRQLSNGRAKEIGSHIQWGLQPRQIPMMESFEQHFAAVRRAENIDVPDEFLRGNKPLRVEGNKTVSFLLDQGALTNAYPILVTSKGKGCEIKLTYAEALFDENRQKGDRNIVEGKKMIGYSDYFLPDGGEKRTFATLWFRTWRYVQVDIKTLDEPLIIEQLSSDFTGYPFRENAVFKSDDPVLGKIWETGWRTARLCAGEMYYDCPYYEQLQYVGDTRIQALISLYVSGDDRLMREALTVFGNSRASKGLTMSRYPTSTAQIIPPYSMFWIDMIHDYWMHRDDPKFVRGFLEGIEGVLGFFINRIDERSGLLGKIEYWNFVDWTDEWKSIPGKGMGGVPQGGIDGQSTILSLHLAYSLKHAADLFRHFGFDQRADYYLKKAVILKKAVNENCWDSTKGYYGDTPAKDEFSMHTQIFAVLTDAIPEARQQEFVRKFKDDKDLIQPTMYFRYYLTRALHQTGLGDNYLGTLDLWHEMLDNGLTTFAEKPDPTRSDCHAWSASPNYDLLSLVAGIEPASPGFKSIKMEPHFGPLRSISGEMPHPSGTIFFDLERKGKNGIQGTVELPEGLGGHFKWNGKILELSGRQKINL